MDGKQKYTNQVGSYTVNWNNFFGENVAMAVVYTGVTQKQRDGLLQVSDSIRIDKITQSVDFTPSYSWARYNNHTFSLHFNYLENVNRNKLFVK